MARRVLEAALPISFRVVSSEEELQAIYRLRYLVAIEHEWARPTELPERIERDSYDDVALQIGGFDRGELVAAQRLVFPAPGVRLPTEEVFGIDIAPRGRVVDVGRSALAERFRGDSRHLILVALQSRSWIEWRSRGFRICAGIMTEPIIRIYREIGLDVEVLGPSREHWGERRYPVRLDVIRAAERLSEIWSDDEARSRMDASGA